MSEENLETKKNKEMQIITESEISSEKTDSKPEIQSLPTTEEKFLSSSNPNLQIIKKRYFGIDLIRVIACFLVMLIHSGEIYYINDEGGLIKDDNNIYPGVINSLSRVSVPLFVMISGYLLLPMKTDYSTFL